MRFELLPAVFDDLDPSDPMQPAVIVHVFGSDARIICEAIGRRYSTYVLGRGDLPTELGDGYFFTAARLDYSTLRDALVPYWPGTPLNPPPARNDSIERLIFSQEFADVLNYTARSPQPDPRILAEARRRMPQAIPQAKKAAFARVCCWLRTHMLPADNCFTLAALLARWLMSQGVHSEFCIGELTFKADRADITIPHTWVEVENEVLDLTVDRQQAFTHARSLSKVARIRIRDRRLLYRRDSGLDPLAELESYWHRYSKPESRMGYNFTHLSMERQATLLKERLENLPRSPNLRRERAAWTGLVMQYGIMEGTARLLEMIVQNQNIAVDGADRYLVL